MSALRAHAVAVIAIAVAGMFAPAARAEPSHRKRAPSQLGRAAADAFTQAVAADDRKDYPLALALYEKANAILVDPSTVYNVADLRRRMGQLSGAISTFQSYLQLAPNAPDRAAVEKTIAELEASPTRLFVTTPRASADSIDVAHAYVLVDGEVRVSPGTAKLVRAPRGAAGGGTGLVFDVAPGSHRVDVVTAITYGGARCNAPFGGVADCSIQAPPRADGNLVVSANEQKFGAVVDDARKDLAAQPSIIGKKLARPAGTTVLRIWDREFECASADVAIDKDPSQVMFVFVMSPQRGEEINGESGVPHCRAFTVKRSPLRFAP